MPIRSNRYQVMTQPKPDPVISCNIDNAQVSKKEASNGPPCECGTISDASISSARNDMPPTNNSNCKKSYSQLKKKNSKKKRDRGKQNDEIQPVEVTAVASPTLPTPKSSWLLRLFESKLCDMAIAIAYMFNSKESGVLAYLGNKLFVSYCFFYISYSFMYFIHCFKHR